MEGTINVKETRKNNTRLIVGAIALLVVAVLAAFFVVTRLGGTEGPVAPEEWPTNGWQSSLPEAEGAYSDRMAEFLLSVREQGVKIHSLQIARNGKMVVDATFYPYDGETIHDVASVTKSVMTTLIGIAVDQGKLSLDDKMVSFFPDREIANLDARKEAITVEHLVSMTSGLQCARDGTEGDSAIEMQRTADYVQYALDLPMAHEPGTQFIYCSPAISLLSPILMQATGMTTLEFARQYLFEPLGIQEVLWETDPQGNYRGWGDLSLHPRDMAKIGLLFLQEGRWEDEQVVSRRWVREARTAQSETPEGEDPYGYGWWLTPDIPGVYRAEGRNGQYIFILPQWNMVVVSTGEGFEMGEIGEELLSTLSESDGPLEANPAGAAQMEAALRAITQPPAAGPVAPLPEVGRAVSGQTYVFEPNMLGLESVALEFDDSAEATAHIQVSGRPMAEMEIGLDGLYRFYFDDVGRQSAVRGTWTDEQTFALEHNSVTANDQMVLLLRFEDERVVVTVSDAYFGGGPTFEGRVDEP